MGAGGGYGAFGKIPALGDFFRFDLSPGFIALWDGWLQAGIQAARAEMGEAWQEAYLSAPIWRFTLAAGLAGASPVQGIFMASVDRVGRQFPLTLARALPSGTDPLALHLATDFHGPETIALQMLEDGADQEGLKRALAALPAAAPPPVSAAPQAAPGWLQLFSPDPARALAATLARQRFTRPAIFTALGAQGEVLYLSEGLPPPARFRQFFTPDSTGETAS